MRRWHCPVGFRGRYHWGLRGAGDAKAQANTSAAGCTGGSINKQSRCLRGAGKVLPPGGSLVILKIVIL